MLYRLWFFILITIAANLAQAQEKNSLLVSFCVQDARTSGLVLEAMIIVQPLDSNRLAIGDRDTLLSNSYAKMSMLYPRQYRIVVNKKDYHVLDTILQLSKNSRSNKKRLGLLMYPIRCFKLKGKVKNAHTFKDIQKGNIFIENLSNNNKTELPIQNGSFEFCGRCSTTYRISTLIQGYFDSKQKVELISDDCRTAEQVERNLVIAVAQGYEASFFEGDSLLLLDFTFEGETTRLSRKGKTEIKRLLRVLTADTELRISILIQAAYFSDTRSNRRIAEKRARLIDAQLTKGGISSSRYLLICKGKVENKRACGNQKISIWRRR